MDMSSLLDSTDGGILHTKFLIADRKTFYLGSANFDWYARVCVRARESVCLLH